MDQNQNSSNNQTPSAQPPAQTTPPVAHHDNKLLFGIMSYLGFLVLVSWAMGKHDDFVKFHVKQGLVIFCIEIVMWILSASFWPLWMLWNLINLATLVLSIIGIINVVHKQQKPLPVIGHLAEHFKI